MSFSSVYLDASSPDQLVTQVLGPDVARGHHLQVIVPSGKFLVFFPDGDGDDGEGFTLWSVVVSPGFDPADDTLGRRTELLEEFPKQRELIERCTED